MYENPEKTIQIDEHPDLVNITREGEREEFKILEAQKDLRSNAYCVMNNIRVPEEKRESFEERFLSRTSRIDEIEGFAALRVLRPLSGEHYVVLTLWDSEEAFKAWHASQQFSDSHKQSEDSKVETSDVQKPSETNKQNSVEKFWI